MSRLFGPRNRRRSQLGARRRRLVVPPRAWVALRTAVMLLVLALVVPPLVRVARRHPYFKVRDVVVRHTGRLTEPELRAALDIVPGISIWDVDTRAAEARLRQLGWVRTAQVQRLLPDRVVVRVREYRPAAIVAVNGDEEALFYVAANGRIFAPVAPTDGRDLPYLTGLTEEDLGGERGFGPRAVHRALALLRLAGRAAGTFGAISEVHVDRGAGLTLVPVRPAVPIELGWGGLGDKLARLQRVLPQWTGREAEIRGVSCVFDNDVIVRTWSGANARLESPARPAGT